MGKSRISLFSVLLVISVLWKPAYTNECSTACKGTPASQAFAPNTKYNYGVEGTVSVYLTGSADNKETSVKLLGQVSVTSLGNCGHELAVQNLIISGPDGKKYQSPPGIEKPIRFSLEDGRLSPEICTQQGDTRRSLNIKRAIISLLQTEKQSSTQVDIFGACPTEIAYSAEGGATLVHRTRDLARCAHREQGKNDLITSVINENAEIKESQVLQSILNVETKVNHGVPEKVSANEEYLYKPFSVGENGARAKVHTKLTLNNKAAGSAGDSHCTIPRTIIFEAPHGVPVQNNVNSALTAVKDTAKIIGSEASEKSAGSFAQIVRIFRVTSKDDLLKVFNQVKNNNLEKRVFLDAVFRTGTGASIEASIQILKSRGLNAVEQQLFVLSFANAKTVNDEALKAVTGLLDHQSLPKEVYLSVGALAKVYCRQHQCHTTKSDGIVALSQKLGSKLQNCKPKTKIEEDSVVAILKGIRSINHLENSLIDKLVHCANEPNVKARVKAAALEAFQADPCSAKLKKTALDILKNRQLDSEIRIKAYQAVIACPCGKSANEIKTLLDSEPVHQVGRYITSSLRHIRSSSNADKRLAKQHYGLITTPKKFNVDDRKLSFYRESSFNVDAIGVGGSVEQSVVYSQNSFLPRSGSLNLTTELFGHSFNILELGARQGNLDLVVEHFLGPKGVLNTHGPQALFDILARTLDTSSAKLKSALNRGRRSIKTEIDGFDKNLKAEETHFDNELDLDIYVKLFGTDAVFLSLGDDKGFDYNKVLDQLLEALTGSIGQAQHLSQELRTHLLFLDAELSYPTSAGLPLRLDLTGAATARIDISTNFDLKQCLSNPQNAKIDIKLIPSSDIEITGVLLVDADAVATGLKVVTNLHSSTGGHLVAKVLENGNGIDLQLGLPVDKQEILVASNDLVYITIEKGQKEKQIKIAVDGDRKEYSECFDQLSGVLGLTLCGEVSLPFSVSGPEAQSSISKYLARYPLSGQSKLKLVLEKNDLKGYHVRGLLRNDNGKTTLDLLFEANGSKNRRTQIIAEKTYSPTEIGVKVAVTSPIKNLGAEISIHTTPSELTALAQANIDNEIYYGKVGFNINGNEQRSVFKPIFEYQLPGEQGKSNVQIDGVIVKESKGPITRYTFEGVKIKLPSSQEPLDVQGFFSNQQNARNMEWQLISDFVTVKGYLRKNDIELEFLNKLNPMINFILNGHSEIDDVIKNEFAIVYSGDCKDQSRRIAIKQFLKYQIQNEHNYNVITKNNLDIAAVPFKIALEADVDPKKVAIKFDVKNVDQKADFALNCRTQIKRPEDYSVLVSANLNNRGFEALAKRDVINNDRSNLQNYLQIKGVGKYELSGVLIHIIQPNNVNVGANGYFKITGSKNEEFKFDIGASHIASSYLSHAKISFSKGDILNYDIDVSAVANARVSLRLIVTDIISANGEFKVTESDGKGNGALIVDLKNSRKIKADVKFQAKQAIFNGDFDIYLNWEKDNNDKICFKTENKHSANSLDSKNKIEYGGKNTELNVHLKGDLELASNGNANIEIVLPTERCLTFKVNRDLTLKNKVYNGVANLLLSDAPKRGADASTISYKAKITDSDLDNAIVDYEGQLEFKLKDGKQLQNTFSVKNKNVGDSKLQFDFKSDLTGNVLKPATLLVSATYLDDMLDSDDVWRIKASYGSDISLDVNAKSVINVQGQNFKKYFEEYTADVRLPFEQAHDIKLASNVMFLIPESQDVTEFTISESVQVNADHYKIDANGKLGVNQGTSTIKLLVPHTDVFVLDTLYKTEDSNNRKALFTEAKVKYGKGHSAAFSLDTSASATGNSVCIRANTPQLEKMKKLEVIVNNKHPAPDSYSSSWIIDADGRVYRSEYSVVLSKAHPVLDLKYISPTDGKTSRIYVKGSSLSSTQGKVEIKVDNVRGISLDAVNEASVQKDNVNFKVQANSEALGWKNFVGQVVSKEAGSGKRLEFHSTNDGKNVLSGSTSFISKQEGQKTIIEGSGSVKVKDEQKSANFKYIRTLLTEGNERGVETFFNIAFGERSYVAESRVTNLEFKNSHVYCEEKKQCANAELQSKIDTSKPGVIANILNANFDLSKLGVTPEIGLTIRDEVSTRKLPQYTLDLHAAKDDRKYHLHIYSTPEFGNSKSGIKISLPSRIMVLENNVQYPTDKPLPFPIEGALIFDMNKREPGHEASAKYIVDLQLDNPQKQTAKAEIRLSHPKIEKDLEYRISGFVARHAENSIKIETSTMISLGTRGDNREAKISLEASPTHLNFVINTPLVRVIEIEASGTVQDKLQKADIKFSLLEGKPVQVEFLVKDFQHYQFTTGYIAEANNKLSVIGHIDPEKKVDVSVDIVLGGQKKNLVHGAIWLDDNLVKSDYGVSKDNCNYFLKALRKDMDDLGTRVKQLGDKANNDFKDATSRIQPQLQRLQKSYTDDLQKLYKEIADDKALKEISQAFNDIVQYVAKVLDAIITGTKPIVDSLIAAYTDFVKKVEEMYEKQIAPMVRDVYTLISNALKAYLDSVFELISHVAAFFTDFFEKHKKDLQALTNAIADIFKDLTRLIVAHLKEYRVKVAEIFQEFTQYVKDLPFLQDIKEKWNELAVPEQAVGLVQQAYELIRPYLPTPEAQAFADTLNEYVMKKLRKDKVDDSKELRNVYQKLIAAVSSLIQFVRNQLNQYGVPAGPQIDSWWNWSPVNSGTAPGLGGSTSISLLKQIITGDLPDVAAIVKAYRPRSFNPLDEIPAKLRAVIVNGEHIFTFDGRHLTFPGSCRYVLAHDYVDRNFTLLLQMAGGKPKALVLEDKSGAVIELKENGQAFLNGANNGFPIEEKESFAFRQPSGRIGLGTKYGLMAFCSPKLEVCQVEISGFYLGKLRGLLGDGNNEPYDDFRLPNGKISTSENEFGNAYRLARSCAQVQVPEHSEHQHHAPLPEACEKVFGGNSPLRPLSLLLDVSPFRQACIHAVAGDQANALRQACDLGKGYASLAYTGLIPAIMPDVCVQCIDANKPRNIGDTYEFKLPAQQADLIITVDTTQVNEKTFKTLVVPLVGQVVDALKGRHCADIKVHLIGITSRFPYPMLYDTDLKLKNSKISFHDKSRYEFLEAIKIGDPKVDELIAKFVNILNAVKNGLGITNVEAAYTSLYDLPLRPAAVKHIINVVGETCLPRDIISNNLDAVAHKIFFENSGITSTLVSVAKGLVADGKPATQVVGFDKNIALVVGDKKPGTGAEALRASLKWTEDPCIEFVEEVGGLVLSSSNYLELPAPQQKQYLQTAAVAIRSAMLDQQIDQQCTCVMSDTFSARSVCITQGRKVTGRRR